MTVAANAAPTERQRAHSDHLRARTERIAGSTTRPEKSGGASVVGGVAAGGPGIPLRYQGDGRFVSALDAEHLFDFTARPDGSADMVMHYYEGAIGAHKAPPKG